MNDMLELIEEDSLRGSRAIAAVRSQEETYCRFWTLGRRDRIQMICFSEAATKSLVRKCDR